MGILAPLIIAKVKPPIFSPLCHPKIPRPTRTEVHLGTFSRFQPNSRILNGEKLRPTKKRNVIARSVSKPENGEVTNDFGINNIESDNVGNTKGMNVLWGEWNYSWDIVNASAIGMVHFLCIFAPSTFSWRGVWLAVVLELITGLLGVTLSYHRNLTHRSFKLPKWLEYFFAYCGVHALQWDPIYWVSTHRYHHQFVDTDKDPHSPIEGFWFSHMSWAFDGKRLAQKRYGTPNNVGDLEKQSFYRFLQKTYFLHPITLAAALYAMGGFPHVVWGMGVRTTYSYHVTFLVNSVGHLWGKQTWNTGDLSKNNWWLALLTFGEGWHNNHHAFPNSARQGLEWWQLDMTWYIIRFLEAIGLATDVQLPEEAHKQRLAFNNNN